MDRERYVLATGEEGARRLRVVNRVHGPDTERFLERAGIAPGMRAADIGCGAGSVTAWIAERVGPGGRVDAIDASPDQIRQARRTVRERGLENVRFAAASAEACGLARGAYDLVFCRFVLMHLADPARALGEMRDLLRPGGVLACEDGDFSSPYCEPSSAAFDRCFVLYRALGERRGLDFHLGRRLYALFLEAGFAAPEVSLAQPVVVRGDAKRLPEWTLEEAAPALIEAGLSSAAEVGRVTAAMKKLAEDDTVLFGMARMTQVWARLPVP